MVVSVAVERLRNRTWSRSIGLLSLASVAAVAVATAEELPASPVATVAAQQAGAAVEVTMQPMAASTERSNDGDAPTAPIQPERQGADDRSPAHGSADPAAAAADATNVESTPAAREAVAEAEAESPPPEVIAEPVRAAPPVAETVPPVAVVEPEPAIEELAVVAAGPPSIAAVTPAIQDLFSRTHPESVAGRQTLAGAVNRFYRSRDQRPVWVNDLGVTADALAVLAVLERASEEGLNPADYLVGELRDLAAAGDSLRARAAFELTLSEAALRYALDMQGWRIIGQQPAANFSLTMPERFDSVLAQIADAPEPGRRLAAFAPASNFYIRLRAQLAVHRQMAAAGGELPVIENGPTIEPGMRDARVVKLRARLMAIDVIPAGDEHRAVGAAQADSRLYDADLVAAVKRFQAQAGLTPDGKVGERSRALLNRSIAEKVDQITLALDWLRTLPRDANPHIMINIPEFRVRVMEGNTEALAMNVIIGRPVRPTPILSSRVTGIIFNPSWTVPRRLAREDKLPILRTKPQTLVDQGFKAYRDREQVDILSVDWNAVSTGSFPYWLRQDPGPRNALGLVRLTFQNNFDVYMHDTPERNLFKNDFRANSSGCIRLERPFDMVEYVLRANTGWDRAAIDAASAKRGTRTLNVDRPVTVETVYMTAIAMPDGTVQFRDDLYGLDRYFLDAQKRRSDSIAGERLAQKRVASLVR